MEYKLLNGKENEDNVFTLNISNREGTVRRTPSRAFKRTHSDEDSSYFTEVYLPVRESELKGRSGYPSFDNTVETRLKQKEVADNVNIISFFGDKSTDIKDLSKFEDLGLLTNFEGLFNDHLIALPYSLNLYDSNFEDMLNSVKESFDSFVTTLQTTNIFGYLPAYAKFRELDRFISFYSGKALGKVHDSETSYNAIPVLVDFKRSSPDSYKRSVAYLLTLKYKYMKEGYYPIYYAANVSRPRTSKKRSRTVAKEFLLSYVGFDIIGAAQAIAPRDGGGGGGMSKSMAFDLEDFSYYDTGVKDNSYRTDKTKAQMFGMQTNYLNEIHPKTLENQDYLKNELGKRGEAKAYLETLKA